MSFKIRTSKYRHVFCDAPKGEVSAHCIAKKLGGLIPNDDWTTLIYCN